jgi:amino acid transporter
MTNNFVDADAKNRKFGTFLGVFTPSVLTILGVMMYLRFGWVVGNLGLPLTLLVVVMASSLTFITGLAASSIATNMKVGVGGEYYMVSRSLGLELGGAIGIPLFLCRTLSLTLYAFGLAESLAPVWPEAWGEAPVQAMAVVAIALITAIAGKSADLSLKLQLPIMVAVGASVLALAVGALGGGLRSPEMVPHYARSAPEGFWYVFAVIFPAVTGFTAGIGMSGDLKDPRRSIPRGTLLAVATGAAVYLLIPLFLSVASEVTGEELARVDPGAPPIWTGIAPLGALFIYPGMWGAILSSAFGSALGGPRVLQALASDRLAPRALARVSRTGQPTIATWVTGAIALAAVALGDLNAVGRWVTIFFLTLYVTINLAATIESLVGDPSYRPTIRVPWPVTLTGAMGAVVVMFLINPVACMAAVALEMVLYMHLRRRALKSSWGDVRAGIWNALARVALLKLRRQRPGARNWRPQILLFTANPLSRLGLVRMASWFNQRRGIVTVVQAVIGDLERDEFNPVPQQREMDDALEAEGLVAFSEVAMVPQFQTGLIGIVQANGFAGLHSNTVMFGWPGRGDGLVRVLRISHALERIQRNMVLVRLPHVDGPSAHRRIDVWWRGQEHNGDLMLLLAYLLNLNPEWRRARVALRTIVSSEAERQSMAETLEKLTTDVRIPAECDVIVKGADQSLAEVMHQASGDADVVFLGLGLPAPGDEEAYAERLTKMSDGFRTTIFVRSAGPFAGQLL